MLQEKKRNNLRDTHQKVGHLEEMPGNEAETHAHPGRRDEEYVERIAIGMQSAKAVAFSGVANDRRKERNPAPERAMPHGDRSLDVICVPLKILPHLEWICDFTF